MNLLEVFNEKREKKIEGKRGRKERGGNMGKKCCEVHLICVNLIALSRYFVLSLGL